MAAILQAEGLCKSYRRRRVVDDVSLRVEPGEIVGLLGPNGAGKSTSFNIVAGLVRPDAGGVRLAGEAMDGLPLYRRAQIGLGYLPQEPTVFRGLSVLDNLLAILEVCQPRATRAHRLERAEALLSDFNLEAVRHSAGAQLSGGERRRVEMARALIPEPKVVLLDEPFAGIDPIAVGEIQGFIRSVAARDIGVLLTDHNVRETLGICDRAYLISEGRILLAGRPAEIVADPRARETYLGRDFAL